MEAQETVYSSESGAMVTQAIGLLAEGSARQLLELLTPVIGIIEKRHTLPVLARVLVRRVGWEVSATSSDLELEYTNFGRLGAETGGAASAVDALGIVKVLKGLERNEHVKLLAEPERTRLVRGVCNYALQAHRAEDFPLAYSTGREDPDDVPAKVEIGAKDLQFALQSICKAMGVNDARICLNGAVLKLGRSTATLVGSNGHWLAKCEIGSTHDPKDIGSQWILPRKAILETLRSIKTYAGPVQLVAGPHSTRASLFFGHLVLQTRLLEGRYPDFERLLAPRDGAFASVELPRAETVAALRRLKPAASEKYPGVALTIGHGTCSLRVEGSESEAVEEVLVNYEGDVVNVGVNINYLTDVLESVNCESATMTVHDEGKSSRAWGMMRVAYRKYPGFEALVMPMRV